MKNFHPFLPLLMCLFLFNTQNIHAQNKYGFICRHTVSEQSSKNDFVFDLPFFEDWEYHNFTHNLWTLSDDAWIIDDFTGNGGASAKFNGGSMQTNYSSTLTSNWLAGDNMFIGEVTLTFDVKLSDFAQSGTEYLYIKLFDGTGYFTLDSLNNNGSFDWETREYDISDLTYGNDFKIVFDAQGSVSSRISGWYIDNIHVARSCEPPTKFYGEFAYNFQPFTMINWSAPEMFTPPSPWKHWDSGENISAIGTSNPFVTIAARWDANTLTDVDGDTIKKIRYFLNDNAFDFMVFHIWTGANAANTLYTDTVYNPLSGLWCEHILNDTLTLDASLEYWVGYELHGIVANTYPFGTDGGPAVTGYGDKVSTDGTTWDNLSDFGLNYNWNIQMYVAIPPDTSSHGLSHFNLYKSINTMDDYYLFQTIDFDPTQTVYQVRDFDIPCTGYFYFYKLNAVWVNNGDTCISPFARDMNFPLHDYIYIIFEEINDFQDKSLLFYPNPVSHSLTISSKTPILEISVYDLSGRKRFVTKQLTQNKPTVDMSSLPKGMYILQAKTEQGIITRKFVKK